MEKKKSFFLKVKKRETYRLIFYMVCDQSRYSRDSLWRCHSKLRIELLQSILIAIIGPLSFVLVGYISVAGRDSGAITFMLSRAPFGFKGNHIPALIGWVGQVGWLSVNVSTGTLTLLALFNTFGFKTSTFLILMSLAIFAGLVIISVLFHKSTCISTNIFHICIWCINLISYNNFNY